MPRTTIDIDATVLRELKRLGRKEGKTLGQLVSELLTRALARDQEVKPEPAFTWASQDMGATVDLEYKAQKADGSLEPGLHFAFDSKTNR